MAVAMNSTSKSAGDLDVLAAWAPELADTFVALSCDIALVLDAGGVVMKLVQHASHPVAPDDWIGRHWPAAVSLDSRVKVEDLLADVAASGRGRRREINHPGPAGTPVAMAYAAVRLGEQGPTLAIGHDLSAQVALQQRFVAAQEALERSYWQARSSLPAPRGRRGAARMTDSERASLGLGAADDKPADDAELLQSLARLYERIGQDELPELMRRARRAAERHFLQQALTRAGSVEALARSLGVSPRALARRSGAPIKPSTRRKRAP
jgi:hypothetical protein